MNEAKAIHIDQFELYFLLVKISESALKYDFLIEPSHYTP